MTEPTSTAACAAAGAVTALPLAIFGAATDALSLGLFAALLVTIWMPTISTRVRAFSAVLLSGVAAGYCAPVLAPVADAPAYEPDQERRDKFFSRLSRWSKKN